MHSEVRRYLAWKEIVQIWFRILFELDINCGKIFVSVFYAPLYNLVIWLIDLFKWSFWLAIISVTIIIRIVLLWPQHKMMVSQRKLQAIQPKIKKIQAEFKGNQQMLWMKMISYLPF